MKKVTPKWLVILCILVTTACSQESENEDLLLENPKEGTNLNSQLSLIILENENETDFITYGFSQIEEGKLNIESKEIIKKDLRSKGFFATKSYIQSTKIRATPDSKAFVVCCTIDGNEWSCVTCPSDPVGEISCLLDQLNSCRDGGGCSTVCDNEKLMYDPSKREFTIYRK